MHPAIQTEIHRALFGVRVDRLVELAYTDLELLIVLGPNACREMYTDLLLPSAMFVAAYRVDFAPVKDLRDELFFESEYHV